MSSQFLPMRSRLLVERESKPGLSPNKPNEAERRVVATSSLVVKGN